MIGGKVGYIDKATFFKKIKDYYGINPSDYRKKSQENYEIKQDDGQLTKVSIIDESEETI